MRDRNSASPTIDPLELVAILEEVRRAVLAVDADTGEHSPLRDLSVTLAPPHGADTAVGR